MQPQSEFAEAGSQRWLQVAINERPKTLNVPLAELLGLQAHDIEWRSPLQADRFKEYRDMSALRLLGVERLPVKTLNAFWPERGPRWDALGRTSNGQLLFVEAKANIPEAASSPTAATPASYKIIHDALEEAKTFFRARRSVDWSRTFFQYANRLAHLYFLREVNKLPAHLVWVYFLNARDVDGPATAAEWRAAVTLIHAALGLREMRLEPYIHTLYVDVEDLQKVDPTA